MKPTEHHARFHVPRQEIERRLSALRAEMAARGIDLAWIDHPVDRHYWSGSSQDGVVLVPLQGEAVFHVRLSAGRGAAESSLETLPLTSRRQLAERLREAAGGKARVALPFDVVSAATYVWLKEAVPGAEIEDLTSTVRTLRATKSAWEIEQMREAGRQGEAVFDAVPAELRIGRTQLQFGGALEGTLRALGHPGIPRVRRAGASVTMLLAVSGESALYPTNFDGPVGGEGPYPSSPAGAGWKKLVAGETVMVDMVSCHNGYHSDNTRVFFPGAAVPDAALRAHDFCLEALRRLEEKIRPGANCGEIYRSVKAWAEGRGEPEGFMGFGENRVRFFGHGIGLELDEMPVLAERVDMELAPGMMIAVEPKAFLPGIGPVGIENTYLVTDGGCESLCSTPREILPVPAA